MNKVFDLICLGRAAVDLYGQQIGGRLEDMQTFAKYLGGSSGNLAAGAARLGMRVSMLTRVGDEQMGRFVRETLAHEGVDVSHVGTDPIRLTALVVLGVQGEGAAPHIFFRENCADMGLSATDFDESFIASARGIAFTGTHLSTPSTREAVEQACRWAAANDTCVILDIDYRPVLGKLIGAGEGESRFVPSEHVTAGIQRVLPGCDLVVGTEEEIRIAGGAADLLTALRSIRNTTSATIVVKRGAAGCCIVEDAVPASLEEVPAYPGFAVPVFNLLGAGDAFLSGFLHGWLDGKSLAESARLGNACGALVVSRHGCTPAMPSALELATFLARVPRMRRVVPDEEIEHVHRATTVRRSRAELHVLAFDHRRQLEELADQHGVVRERVATFKGLIADAVEHVADRAAHREQLGVIVDARHGSAVLNRLGRKGFWVGRPIEMPGSRPITFDPPENADLHLATWPTNQVIKCLVFYHPDDLTELRLAQEQRVRELHGAACALERDLLLEIISGGLGLPIDDDTTARALRRIYHLGVRPAWWKLAPQSDASWRSIGKVIEEHDPWCNGVLLLGLDAPEDVLLRAFESAARAPICRGFAVGRSIFYPAARAWFAGHMSDESAIADIATRYARLIEGWRAAQSRVHASAARPSRIQESIEESRG